MQAGVTPAKEAMQPTRQHGSIRESMDAAIAGEPVTSPVFAVYDWFVRNRHIDWQSLFDLGLGQINHADLIRYQQPNVEILETRQEIDGVIRRDVRWITDIGELHEWYMGEWRQEYLIKEANDYRIMQRAWQATNVLPWNEPFLESQARLGDSGITLGQLDRTPFQKIQIDYAGLERFSIDIATQEPGLLGLIEIMNPVKLREFETAVQSPARQIKLWENLTIDTMGPHLYRKYLVPLYNQIFAILEGSGKKLQVHYDGKLRVIAGDIQRLPFDGLDSVTPPPEGDLSTAEARQWWPDKFLWLHPSLTWYDLPLQNLLDNVRQMVKAAGSERFCLMISEELPPNWQTTVPAIIKLLNSVKFN
jgi:hypothetical protein